MALLCHKYIEAVVEYSKQAEACIICQYIIDILQNVIIVGKLMRHISI